MARKKPARNPTPRKNGRRPKGSEDWRPIFLEALRCGIHITDAAEICGVNRKTPYDERATNEEFRKAWNQAQRIGGRELKAEARRRAYHGTEKPVYQGGKLVGHIREYDNNLLKWLIEVKDLAYRLATKHQHGGDPDNKTPIQFIEVATADGSKRDADASAD